MNEENTLHSMVTSSFGDTKMSKENELNSSMSIQALPDDELTSKLQGGNL